MHGKRKISIPEVLCGSSTPTIDFWNWSFSIPMHCSSHAIAWEWNSQVIVSEFYSHVITWEWNSHKMAWEFRHNYLGISFPCYCVGTAMHGNKKNINSWSLLWEFYSYNRLLEDLSGLPLWKWNVQRLLSLKSDWNNFAFFGHKHPLLRVNLISSPIVLTELMKIPRGKTPRGNSSSSGLIST